MAQNFGLSLTETPAELKRPTTQDYIYAESRYLIKLRAYFFLVLAFFAGFAAFLA